MKRLKEWCEGEVDDQNAGKWLLMILGALIAAGVLTQVSSQAAFGLLTLAVAGPCLFYLCRWTNRRIIPWLATKIERTVERARSPAPRLAAAIEWAARGPTTGKSNDGTGSASHPDYRPLAWILVGVVVAHFAMPFIPRWESGEPMPRDYAFYAGITVCEMAINKGIVPMTWDDHKRCNFFKQDAIRQGYRVGY